MSILIKSMKMPKDCFGCTMPDYELGYCHAMEDYNQETEYYKRGRRPSWCPLVEVPKHGRLIDADALDGLLADMAKEYPKRPLDSIGGYWIDKFRNMLKATPTIIPAEVE